MLAMMGVHSPSSQSCGQHLHWSAPGLEITRADELVWEHKARSPHHHGLGRME